MPRFPLDTITATTRHGIRNVGTYHLSEITAKTHSFHNNVTKSYPVPDGHDGLPADATGSYLSRIYLAYFYFIVILKLEHGIV